MKEEIIIINGVEITQREYPKIWDMAKDNPKLLKRNLDGTVAYEHSKGNTKFTSEGALRWLNDDLE